MSDDRSGALGERWRRFFGIVFDSIPRAVAGLLILAGVVIIFANVVSRYLFSSAIFWAEEILVFMIVGLVATSAVAVTFRRAHLGMDLLLLRAPRWFRRFTDRFITLAFVGCCGFVVLQSVEIVAAFHRTGTVSIAAGVPLVVPHTVLLIGLALMIAAVLAHTVMFPDSSSQNEEESGSDDSPTDSGQDQPWRG